MSENLKNNLLKKIKQTDNEEDIYELFSTDFNNDTINEKDRYKIIKLLFHKFPKIDISRKINEKTIFDLILEKIGKEYRLITIKTLSKKIINAFKNYKDKETLIEKFLIDNNIYIANFLIRHFTLEDVRSIKSIKSIKNKKKLFEIIIALNNFEIFREIYNSGTKLENSELFDITKIAFEYKSAEIINFLKEKNEFNDINFQQLSQTLQKVNDFDIKLYDNIMLEKDIESTETSFKINKNRQGINQIKFIEREIEYNDDAKTIKTVKDTAYANLKSTEEKRKLYEVIYENDGTKKIIYYDKDKNPLVTANIAEDNTLTFTDFTKNYSEEKIDEILNDDYLKMETFDYNLSYLSYAPLSNKENVIFKTKCEDINSIVNIISESNNEKNKGKTFICDFGIDGHNVQILVSNRNATLLNTGFGFEYIRDEIEQKCKEKGLENVNIKHVETTNQAVGNCVEASKLYTVALVMEYENKYKTLDRLSERLNRFEKFMENILSKETIEKQSEYLNNNFTKEDEEILDILSKAHEKLLMKEEHFKNLDCRFSKFLSIFENIPEIKSAKINNMINSCNDNAKEINRIEKSGEESLIYNITDTHGDSLSVAGALKQSGFIIGVNETKVLYYDVDKDEFLDTIPSLENMTLEEFKKRYTIISDFDIPDFENIPKGTFVCTGDMQDKGLEGPESFAMMRLLIKKYVGLYRSSNRGIDSEELEQKAKEFVLKKININIFNQNTYLLSKDEADLIVKDLKIDNGKYKELDIKINSDKYSKSLINIFEKGYIDIFDYGIMLLSITDKELIEYAKTKYNNNPLLKLKIYKLVADRKKNQEVMYNCGLMFDKGDGIPVDKKEAARYYKMAADKGNVDALYKYSLMLNKGDGIPANKKEAVKYIKMVADRGNTEAMYRYGYMLKNGDGIPVNKKEAARYYKMAADNGDNKGMFGYGLMLNRGEEIPADKKEAARYYKMAADKGIDKAMCNYGYMLENGDGIPVDKKEAARYYKMAADKGNTEAIYRYGLMLNKGEGIPVNKKEAARYIKMAADKGNTEAMYRYGLMLNKGEGIPVNKKEAARYIKMAADKGNTEAMYRYGLMLNKGEEIPVNKKEAARYYKMAADKGNTDAMFSYGLMLNKGEEIPVNKKEAARYYKMAADKGNTKAMHNYGLMLNKGDGIPMNKKEAARYYKMAVDKGSVRAMYSYGYMLENGEGVPANKEEAARYYKMAADKGNDKAMYNYGSMLYDGEGVKMNKEEAARYIKMAVDKGSVRAMYSYGYMLKNGEGIPVNKKEAARYIKMAADKGNTKAMRNYGYMLENGDNVNKNLEEAIIYYKMAADKGNADDMYNYGLILDKIKEIPGDKKREAIIYYKMAADRGNADAMYRYGLMLEDGEGIGTNKEEAARYYEMAAKKGQVTALCNYGSMLYDGEGVEMNKEEAAKYYKMAADKGSVRAMYSYGYMLENGEGVPVNKEEAARYYEMVANNKDIDIINNSCLTLEDTRGVFKEKEEVVTRYYKMATGQEDVNIMNNYNSILDKKEWVPISKEEILGYYKVAADNGNICAMFEYGAMMLNEETGITINKEEAIKYIKMAADKGDVIAMEEYSTILESGNGVPVNKKEAAKYCKMAADKGSIEAMYDYGVMLEKGYGVKINENEAIRYYKMAADLDYDEAKKKLNSINAEKNKVKTDSSTPSPEGEQFFKTLSEIEKLIDNEQTGAKNASEHVLL